MSAQSTTATAVRDQVDSLVITPKSGALGADVAGIDLSHGWDEHSFAAISDALLHYQVLFFEGQSISPALLAQLGQRFGDIESEPFIPKSEDSEGVHVLKGFDREKLTAQNLGWHVDHSYQEIPTKVILLHALDVPETGNDTLFASLYQPYDDLPQEMKDFFASLTVIHDVLQYGLNVGHYGVENEGSLRMLLGMRSGFPQVEHPLVCTHPETKRKFLYVNPAWSTGIKGFSKKESQMVLSFLFDHTTQPIYQCRQRWKNNALAIWDNRCIQHSPVPDHFGPRHMQRVAVKGDWRPS